MTTAQKHTGGPHNVGSALRPIGAETQSSKRSMATCTEQRWGEAAYAALRVRRREAGPEQSLPPAACSSHRLRPVLLSPPSRGEAAAGRKCVQRAAMRASGGQLGL